jgi:hypothetical protein
VSAFFRRQFRVPIQPRAFVAWRYVSFVKFEIISLDKTGQIHLDSAFAPQAASLHRSYLISLITPLSNVRIRWIPRGRSLTAKV